MAGGEKLDPTAQTQMLAPDLDITELPTAFAPAGGLPSRGTPFSSPGESSPAASPFAGSAEEFRRSLHPGRQVGRFALERELGEGGMGLVFLAHDPELNRKVALKVLHPGAVGTEGTQAQQRMLREAQAMAMVSHPNLVTIYEVGTYRRTVFLAMEYVVGSTLDDWLDRDPPLEDIFEVLVQAGLALQAVHDAGLVHRDFKPANVLVTEDLRAKVLDLGIARKSGGSEPPFEGEVEPAAGSGRRQAGDGVGGDVFDEQLTQEGAVVGTPAYMPPEQLIGEEVSPASDLFSFSVVLFEALTGQRPFEGNSYDELLANIISGERKAWPDDCEAPERLRQVVVRGLSAKAEDRFGSMRDLLSTCEDALGLRGQVRFLCRRWLDHERHPEYLIGPGSLLAEGRKLLRDNPEALSPDQRDFVAASARAVDRRRLHRRVLLTGLGVASGAVFLSTFLLEHRSRQLEEATRRAVAAHIDAVQSGVAGVFATAEQKVRLLFAQRRVWLPRAEELFAVEERSAERILPLLRAMNDLFRPFIRESPSVSSLMVSRDDGMEYLAFEDLGAEALEPPYRFYNRLINRSSFGQDAFQVFSGKGWDAPSWVSWLPVGGTDSRGQTWGGYAPASRIWFQNAASQCCGRVVWTQPYLFFVTKDSGITASIAVRDGGSTYVLGVDFMLTDLSKITTGRPDDDYWCTIVDAQGRIVSLPRDDRFMNPEAVREFFVRVDQSRRGRADEGKRPDVAARLPVASDLSIPALTAALDAAAGLRADVGRDRRMATYSWREEQLAFGTAPVGAPEQGLSVVVAQKPVALRTASGQR